MVQKMFKTNLHIIKQELNNHKHNKEDVFRQCVIERLNKGLQSYEKELDIAQDYLLKKNTTTILKRV